MEICLMLLGRLDSSVPSSNNASLNVWPSVRLSENSFYNFSEIWFVDGSRWVTHDCIPVDPLQGSGHGGQMCENDWFQSLSSHVIKRLVVNYDTPRQYLNFNSTDFWYSSLFGVKWPSNVGCSTLANELNLLRDLL